jgi:hypothetical protein
MAEVKRNSGLIMDDMRISDISVREHAHTYELHATV